MEEKILHNSSLTPRAKYLQEHVEHWNRCARLMDRWHGLSRYYHRRLEAIYQYLIPPNQRVLEIGCGQGDLLAALRPSLGMGVDISPEMISRAGQKYPQLHFIKCDACAFESNEKFDFIILSDIANELWDVQCAFQNISRCVTSRTRIIINSYSRLWQLPLSICRRLHLAIPLLDQNWLTAQDISNLLYLTDFEVIMNWNEIMWPLPTPIIAGFFNRFLVKFWPFKLAALANFIVARPLPIPKLAGKHLVSVIVPARNEAGNIREILKRTPEMGSGTELIFVEGHSHDNTYETIAREIANNPQRPCKLLRQTGIGKGDAVRLGFSQAQGEVLMILDADMTVPPEDLPRFFEALVSGKGEVINGVRLIYPMEKQAMRLFNLIGNKFFSMAFSWLLGQPIKDTLCGTKVLWKDQYEKIAANRGYFGNFDPFGDFEILFGAAKLNMKIIDLPIRYCERIYGATNIQRWRHGLLLLQMLVYAARRIKFF